MRVEPTKINTVAFLVVEEETTPGVLERVPKATAFFVLVQEEETWHPYTVTARHCIEEAGEHFWIRVNTEDGIDDIPTRASDWSLSDEADVAVAAFLVTRPGGYNLSAIDVKNFVGADGRYDLTNEPVIQVGIASGLNGEQAEDVAANQVGRVEIGHDVLFAGLFIQHAGAERNLPIARFGQIARLPSDEPILVERRDGTTAAINGYLVESRSWGGHSGSPVWWHYKVVHLLDVTGPDGKVTIQEPEAAVTALLGLVSGHFDIKQRAETQGDILGSVETRINAGIAIVTPAEDIRRMLLDEEGVVKERKERVEATKRARPTATFDFGPREVAEESEFDRFQRLTQQLVNTPKQKPEEES